MKRCNRKRNFIRLTAVLVFLAMAKDVSAAGFSLYETSPRGVAMGGATMGFYSDPSAVYANPALLTDSEGIGIQAGLSGINPAMDFTVLTPYGKKTYSPEDEWFPPPFLYYSQKLGEDWALGAGIYCNYGLGVKNDETWPGRYASLETKVTAFDFNPNIAYRINDELSVAAGLDVVYFKILITRQLPIIELPLRLEADTVGYGGNFAISYKPTEDIGIGLVYRSEVREEFDGSHEGDGKIGGRKVSDVYETMTFPQSVSLGVNYTGIDRWNLGFIARWTGWSSYDNITFHFKQPLMGKITESGSDKDWKDVWRLGIGAEYQVSEGTAIQAGYVFDQDPINLEHGDYMMPAGSRNIFSIGMTTQLDETWTFGIAYAYVLLRDRHVNARPAEGVLDTDFENGDTRVVTASFTKTF